MTTLQERTTATPAVVEQIESMEKAAPWRPGHEFTVTEREVRLSVDLPGVLAKNLHVACHEGRLHVWGRRNESHHPKALAHASTRRCGDFALDVEIPDWTDLRRAFQAFDAGILTVAFPRRRESMPSAHGTF